MATTPEQHTGEVNMQDVRRNSLSALTMSAFALMGEGSRFAVDIALAREAEGGPDRDEAQEDRVVQELVDFMSGIWAPGQVERVARELIAVRREIQATHVRLARVESEANNPWLSANRLAALSRISMLGFGEAMSIGDDGMAERFNDTLAHYTEQLGQSPAYLSSQVFADAGMLDAEQVAA